MHSTSPTLRIVLGLGLTITACGDDSSADGGSSGDGGSTAADTTGGIPATTGTSEVSSTGTPVTTTTATSTSSTGTPDPDSSSGAPSDSSSGGESTGGTGTTGGDEGGMVVPEPWGDCVNLPPENCLMGETCISDAMGPSAFGVCSQPGCVTAMDCPAAPLTGDAPVACIDIAGDMGLECVLDCSGGQTCPDTMTCFGGAVCTHELVAFACADDTAAGPLPIALMGSTVGAGDDSMPPCGSNSEDFAYQFTAPLTATYDIDTIGSGFDTILYVFEDCGGPPLGCNDDTFGLQSRVTVDLLAGQTVLVIVDGFEATGDFNLNIDLQTFDGDCCTWDMGVAGCEVPSVETCVCGIDNYCCKVQWDDLCVDIATADCNANCPL